MIEVKNVRHRYAGHPTDALALDDVSFTVPRGCCFGLLGPNGAGKSTLLGLMTAALRLQVGDIRIAGYAARAEPAQVKRLGSLVPQELAFYPTLTGRENLAFFAGIQGLTGAAWHSAQTKVVETCALHEVLNRRAETYSGGLKRRLNLAIGLLNQPLVLYLDEPTVGIDALSRSCIQAAIQALRASGTTIVYTSHYMEEVEALCDELAVLDGGRLVASSSTAELLERAAERRLELVFDTSPADLEIAALNGLHARWLNPRSLVVALDDVRRVPDILSALAAAGHSPSRVAYCAVSLEDVYRSLLAQAA